MPNISWNLLSWTAVIGDSKHPSTNVVLAPRGAGKTALRRKVEDAAISNKFLAVTYDRFEFSPRDKISELGLSYHLRNIIKRVLIAYLSYVSEHKDLINRMDKERKIQLSYFIKSYLGDLTGRDIRELLLEIRSIPEKLRDYWTENVGLFESAINFLLKAHALPAIDVPDAAEEQKNLSQSYKHQLEFLRDLAKEIGFNSIYILVDKVDETERTGNDPKSTYDLVRPMLRDLELLGTAGFGFKFFLWNQIGEQLAKDARTDRFFLHNLNWTREGLREILASRLSYFSGGQITDFGKLFVQQKGLDTEGALCVLASGSPRTMIRFGEAIFATQAQRNPRSDKIDFEAFDVASIEISDVVTKERYSPQLIGDLQRVGQEIFTNQYISNDILKMTSQAAGKRIAGWTEEGAVKQVSSVATRSTGRPINLYGVVDPLIVRLIHRQTRLDEFIKDRWIPCNNCKVDNVIDLELYPDTAEELCAHCSRPLLE